MQSLAFLSRFLSLAAQTPNSMILDPYVWFDVGTSLWEMGVKQGRVLMERAYAKTAMKVQDRGWNENAWFVAHRVMSE